MADLSGATQKIISRFACHSVAVELLEFETHITLEIHLKGTLLKGNRVDEEIHFPWNVEEPYQH